jgi:ABC-type multidrug transport system fused ATPase/permease subunit
MVLVIHYLVDVVLVSSVNDNPNLALSVVSFVTSLILWFLMELLIKNQSVSLGMYVTTTLSKTVYSTVLEAEMNEIEKHTDEEIVKKITKDCDKIGNTYIGKNWIIFFREAIVLIATFITFMAIQPILGLVTFATLPFYFTIVKSFKKYTERLTNKYQLKINERETKIAENVKKIKNIKIKNGIVLEKEEFQKQNDNYVEVSKHIESLENIKNNHLFELLVGLVLTLVIGLGGYFSTRFEHIPGTIVAFIILIPLIYTSFNRLMSTSISASEIENEVNAINEIINIAGTTLLHIAPVSVGIANPLYIRS